MKVFLDTNVLLDVLCRSGRPSAEASSQILQAIRSGRMEGVITTQSIVDAAYILSRGNVQQPFLQAIETLLRFVNVRPIDAMDIRDALLHPTGDFEDDVQFACAETEGCDLVITSDRKRLNRTKVPGEMLYFSPETFVARMAESSLQNNP